MKKIRNRTYKNLLHHLGGLLAPVIMVLIILCFATATDQLDADRTGEACRQLEIAIRRGCVACYAAEGYYPTTLDYLQEHYGIQVDEKRYTVFYEAFGSNLMPNITVLERQL